MKIDAHQHYWSLARGDYGWLTPALAPIYRDFRPDDLASLRLAYGIARTILVQAAPTTAETDYLLDLATRDTSIAGVVGWLDFDASDAVARVHASAAKSMLVGLRPMMQDLPDDDWMLGANVGRALAAMATSGLVFDALVKPRHLTRVIVLAERHPTLQIVLDHGGKPDIAKARLDRTVLQSWRSDIAALARRPNVVVKLSGLVTEAGPDWTVADIAPVAAHLIDTFGPNRILWGSDWPVLNLASDYAGWAAATDALLAGLCPAARDAVLGGNAARIYLSSRGRT